MKHLKRAVSWVLAASLVVSASSFAYAAVSDSVRFLAAVQKTNQRLRAEEDKVWELMASSEKLTENILTKSYDTNMTIGAELDTYYTTLKNIDFDMKAKLNLAENEIQNNMSLSLGDGTDTAEASISAYVSDEEIVANVPQLFEEYLRISLSEIDSSYLSVDIRTMMDAMFGNNMESLFAISSKESMQASQDRYNQLLLSFLGEYDPSAFNAAPSATVPTSYGDVVCEGVTLSLTPENLNTIMDKFADTLAGDPWLQSLYGSMFQSYAMLGLPDGQTMLDQTAQTIRDYEFESGMDLTAYINAEGYIIRYVADFAVEQIPVQVVYDQKGQAALADELEFSFTAYENEQFIDVDLSLIGNTIPENGPLTYKMKASYNFNDVKQADIFTFDYSWDTESGEFDYSMDFNGDFDVNAVKGEASYQEDYEAYLEFLSYLNEGEAEADIEVPMTYEEYVAEMESYAAPAPITFTLGGSGTYFCDDEISKFVLTENKFETEGISLVFDLMAEVLPSTEAITAIPEGAEVIEMTAETATTPEFDAKVSANLEKLMLDFTEVFQ